MRIDRLPRNRLPSHVATAMLIRQREPVKNVRRVRINRSPMMLPLFELEKLNGFGSEDQYLQRAAELRADSDFVARLLTAAQAAVPTYPLSRRVESQLYARFANDEDERVMAAFHDAEWSARPEIVRQFGDERFVRLGYRQIFFERPDLLDEKTRIGLQKAVARRHTSAGDGDVPWTTIAAARSRIEAMLAARSGSAALLEHYRSYLASYQQVAQLRC